MVGADTPEPSLRRLQTRVVPSLEALLSAALEREALLSEVVETASLRRADAVKTAVLRAVSHDCDRRSRRSRRRARRWRCRASRRTSARSSHR